jgi:hypothetical protein
MSYDLYLADPKTGKTLETKEKHQISGGTYAIGGSTKLSLNITWNYADHYYKAFGDEGIRSIYGTTGLESISIIADAIVKIGKDSPDYDDSKDDYWTPSKANAVKALLNLILLATSGLDGLWQGD